LLTRATTPTRSSRGSKRATLKANRKEIRDCYFALYCERNLVERLFNKIKHYRAIATRFDKLANTFLAGVLLVCVVLWLN
jgi:transposase